MTLDDLDGSNLLTRNQLKLKKSLNHGYLTCGINLSPAKEAASFLNDNIKSMCPMSGFCGQGCLNKSGLNRIPNYLPVRVKRTLLWIKNPKVFLAQTFKEIKTHFAFAKRNGLKFAIRPNLLSDQPKLAHAIAKEFPEAKVYDYSKLRNFHKNQLDNYTVTYSFSERTREEDVVNAIDNGINIAVIFALKKKDAMPKSIHLFGHKFKVIDGDAHDLRFLDPKKVVVGLRWKGSYDRMEKAVDAGFAIRV